MAKKLLFTCLFIFALSFVGYSQKPGSYKAVDLDGTDDYIAIPDNSSLNPTSKITVEAWIKADVWGASNFTNSIFCKHGWASGQKGYVLRCGDNGKLGFNISNAAGAWVETISGSVMKTGVWYHVAGIFSGDTVAVYINGNLEAFTLYSGTISASSGLAAKIGDLAYGGGRYFDGQIDEVRVWGTALSKATLRNWMCRKVTKSHPDYNSLGGYWKMDEGSGTDAKDQSTNAITGTLTGGTRWANSGAALGDTTVHIYGGSVLGMKTKFGDIFTVRNITGSPGPVHAFVNYATSEQTNGKNVTGSIDSTHYFGVYYADNSAVNFDISYNFKNYAKVTGVKKCAVNMLAKTTGNLGAWDLTPLKLYDGGDSLVIKKQVNKEYILALYTTDSNQLMSTISGVRWFCGGDSLLISATGNDTFNYTWFKNGNLLSGKTKRTLWASSTGNYRVKMTRKGTTCSFSSASITITSKSTPVTWNYSLTTCENSDSIQLTPGTPAGGFFSGKWVSSNGYFHPKRAGAGNFILSYNFVDTNQCVNKAANTVTLLDTSKLNITPIQQSCFGAADITLNNVSPAGGSYQGNGVSGNMFSYISAGIGDHTITYIFKNSKACTSKGVFNIIIHKPDSISLSLKDKACNYDGPILVTTYPAGGTLQGKAVVGQNFYPPFAVTGWNWVYYSIMDSHQCQVLDSAKIYVAEAPKAILSAFANVCDNAPEFKLSGGQPADSGMYFIEGVSNEMFSPFAMGKGQFKVEYKVINYYGCRDSATTSITVNQSPVKPVISISKNTLVSSAVNGNQWLDKNGPIIGATQQNYNPAVDGYYFVKVTNDSNCSITSDSFVFIKTGVENFIRSSITIYPNPSNNRVFNIVAPLPKYDIIVTDPLGSQLVYLKNQKINSRVDLGIFGSGTYFITLLSEGKRFHYKVVAL